jgi:hypothetical protein
VERAGIARIGQALVALIARAISGGGGGWPERLAVLLLGLGAFLLVVGPAPLDPTNIAWLGEADAATNYLGWAFFRSSPWGWPLAANPAYGLDIAGSVMMADANPLMALPFKLLGPLLPTPFQYFGLWLLLCFLLQGLFAHGIARKITPYAEQRLAIVLLFLFTPFFLIRIATPAVFHMTLVGQWQILAALCLYLSPDLRRRAGWWAVLLGIAILTHPYLFALVAAIWLADIFRALIAARQQPMTILLGALLGPLAVLILAKLSGVFWLQGAGVDTASAKTMSVEWGFAIYKANLLTAFDPDGWSLLLPDIRTKPEQIEGFAYLGLGMLLLLIATLFALRRLGPWLRLERQHWPLALILIGCALFSLSDYVELGEHMLHLPWPAPLIGLGNMFRSTGRFVWPVAYVVMILILWAVAVGWRRPIASALLAVAAVVQIVDTSAGWRAYASTFGRQGSSWPTGLTSPFWAEAHGRYSAIRLVVPRNHAAFYRDLDMWALDQGIGTDITYLARYDRGAMERLIRLRAAQFAGNRLRRDTLWILDGVPTERIAAMKLQPGDFVGIVDGLPLFAPGLRRR